MAQCVIIADDLTGGNATGVLLAKMNYNAYTVLNPDAADRALIQECDCLICPTDSRAVSEDEAYRRVYKVCRKFLDPGVRLYAHRIDSTLRGNVGVETDAMLDCLGKDYIAVLCACYPDAGRIVSGGYMVVESIPLHKTSIAVDPKSPVKISDVAAIVRQTSKYQVDTIMMNDMMHGKHRLADLIREKVREGTRIISFDCLTQEDLELIADAIITSKQKVIAVDPGVFTSTLARKLITPSSHREKSKILAVVGSVHPRAQEQMEELWLSQRTNNIMVRTREFLESEERREAEIRRVADGILAESEKAQISTITGDGIYPENRIDFEPYIDRYGRTLDEVSGMINTAFAEIAYRIFKGNPHFRGLYTSGGDITVSVCERFGATGLRLREEVLPLAAYGQLFGGEFDGVHIVTKGGSQGNSGAINRCITYLRDKLYI